MRWMCQDTTYAFTATSLRVLAQRPSSSARAPGPGYAVGTFETLGGDTIAFKAFDAGFIRPAGDILAWARRGAPTRGLRVVGRFVERTRREDDGRPRVQEFRVAYIERLARAPRRAPQTGPTPAD